MSEVLAQLEKKGGGGSSSNLNIVADSSGIWDMIEGDTAVHRNSYNALTTFTKCTVNRTNATSLIITPTETCTILYAIKVSTGNVTFSESAGVTGVAQTFNVSQGTSVFIVK